MKSSSTTFFKVTVVSLMALLLSSGVLLATPFGPTPETPAGAVGQYVGPYGAIMDLGADVTFIIPENALGDIDKITDGLDKVAEEGEKLAEEAEQWIPDRFEEDFSDMCDDIIDVAEDASELAEEEKFEKAHRLIHAIEDGLWELLGYIHDLEDRGRMSSSGADECRKFIEEKLLDDGLAMAHDNVGTYITGLVEVEEINGMSYVNMVFGPHGTYFSQSADLWVPRDLIDFYSLQNTALYSPDGVGGFEQIDPPHNYTSDWVIFTIEHFSQYYYRR